MSEVRSGTVAFLFTDVEGSTRLWEAEPRAMSAALARHDALLRQAVDASGGEVFKMVGDAVCAVFGSPEAAIAAAVAAQRHLAVELENAAAPLHVRMAIHAGEVEERDGDYFGPPLNRVARLLAAAHGGQILVSRAAAELARDAIAAELRFRDLGEHALKDLRQPERVFQIVAPDLPADFPPLRTPGSLRRNVPAPPTPLIGREPEVAAVRALLGLPPRDDVLARAPARETAPARLVTLTGPGGAGKTRLSIDLASELSAEFADGAAFVPLAALTDPTLVPGAIAAALDLRDGGASPRDLLLEQVRDRQLLLVLDNFEQVMGAVPLVADLLAGCPRLTVLATSRERLNLRGERELPVPPLTLPAPVAGSGVLVGGYPALALDDVRRSGAVRLFEERARSVNPRFGVSEENAAAVVEICRRLDGLPLAIELAAARIRLLPPAALLKRLDRRLDLLAGGQRDLPARQQTMRDTIAWSYDLLDPAEQALFARLSIFVGGVGLDMVELVLGDGFWAMGTDDDPQPITQNLQPDVVDLLASLADKSLIRLSADGDDAPRVAMLETIRDFGAERLAASGEAHAVARRHAESFLAVAEEAAQYLEGPEQRDWLERLERDHPNLRAALAWLRDHGDAEATLRLGSALWRFWWLRGHFTEGRQQLDSLLRMPAPAGSTADRARVLNAAGVLAECQGDCDQAEALHEESLALFRRLDDRRGIASALDNLGVVAVDRGQYERAESLLEESLAIARDLDDAWMIATVVTDLGNIAAYRRDHQRAVDFYRAGLDLFRQVGDGGQVAKSLNNLGVATVEGGFDGAEELFNEALLLLREGGDKQGMTQALNNLATVALDADDLDRATALYHESLALARETGDKLAIAIAVQNLAELADRRGEAERSQGLYREALALYRTVGDWQGAADCLAGLAKVAETQGLPALTVRLFAAAASVRSVHDLSSPVGGDDERRLDAARQALGTEAFDRHWLVGQTSSFDQLVAEFGAPDRSGHRMQAAVR